MNIIVKLSASVALLAVGWASVKLAEAVGVAADAAAEFYSPADTDEGGVPELGHLGAGPGSRGVFRGRSGVR